MKHSDALLRFSKISQKAFVVFTNSPKQVGKSLKSETLV